MYLRMWGPISKRSLVILTASNLYEDRCRSRRTWYSHQSRFADKRSSHRCRLLDQLEKGKRKALYGVEFRHENQTKQLATQSAKISLMLSKDTLLLKQKNRSWEKNTIISKPSVGLLKVNDANLAARYDFFYKEIAPRIEIIHLPSAVS